MKKSLIAVFVAAVLVASFGVVGSVYAQGGNPNPGSGYGVATRQQLQTEDGSGLYHDEIMAAFAEALDMTVEEIEAKIAEGFTIVEIAQAEGLSLEEIRALMPVGNFGGRSEGWMGRGFMANGENAEFAQGPLYLGDGTCLEDGQPVREFVNQMGMGRGRGR
ncbi:MAG: hypothetical protein RBT01_04475 [Anaerolineaceae bacterium]|nr:hypothetical protein [Anaerolineaceae bacterium]